MNPQMRQVALPVSGSNSRMLGQPLVPQKRRELTDAPYERRRIRRIAEARPVTDDVVERVIMVICLYFLTRRDREMSDRLRGWGFVSLADNGWKRRCSDGLRAGPGAGFGRSNRAVASD